MTSYIAALYQLALLNDCVSIVELVNQGVPQGSILRPLLYRFTHVIFTII